MPCVVHCNEPRKPNRRCKKMSRAFCNEPRTTNRRFCSKSVVIRSTRYFVTNHEYQTDVFPDFADSVTNRENKTDASTSFVTNHEHQTGATVANDGTLMQWTITFAVSHLLYILTFVGHISFGISSLDTLACSLSVRTSLFDFPFSPNVHREVDKQHQQ